MRRHLAVSLALSGALALTGCTPAGPTSPTTASPAATGDATLASTTAWAGSVCTSLADVRSAVDGIGEGLSINPLAGAGALEDARAQIESQVGAVGAAVADLRAAVAAAPDEPGARAIRDAIEGSLDDLDAAQRAAAEQAQATAAAGSVPEFLAAAGGALVAVREAGSAVGDLYQVATGSGSGAGDEARAAFAQAPACQALSG